MAKNYEINPCGLNGELFWKMTFEDGTEDYVPFDQQPENIQKEFDYKNLRYIAKKRREKINRIKSLL